MLDGVSFTGCAWAYLAGEHVVVVSTSDTFGNVASETVRFAIDVTEPDITIVSPQDGGFVGGVTVEVTVAISDEYGMAGVTVNGAALTVDAGGQFGGAAVLPAEGINELTFVATDTAGNSRTARIRVVRDTIPPAITIDVPQDGAVVGTETMVSGVVTDAGPVVVTLAGAAVSLDGDGRFSQRIQIQAGQHQIVITAVDGAGNVSSRSRTVSDGISTRYCYDGAGNMVGRATTPGADCGAL
jgi:YD repeat-containing protein